MNESALSYIEVPSGVGNAPRELGRSASAELCHQGRRVRVCSVHCVLYHLLLIYNKALREETLKHHSPEPQLIKQTHNDKKKATFGKYKGILSSQPKSGRAVSQNTVNVGEAGLRTESNP